jgi:hypothetical protein
LKVLLNIILPSVPRFHKSSPSLRFQQRNHYAPLISLVRATCPAHPSLFTLITRLIFADKYRSLRDHLQSFFSLYCFQLPNVMLQMGCERLGLILSLFDQNIPSRKNFKERKYSRILTFFFGGGGFLLVVSILEVTLVKTILFIFKKLSCLSNQQLWHEWELWYGLKRLEMNIKFSSEHLKGKRKLGRSNRRGKDTTKMNIRTAGRFDVR